MARPKIIVFFSGQGGACKGFEDAGWNVVRAVDIAPQPNYYRREAFLKGDAVDPDLFWDLMRIWRPHAVSGSPPCQWWTLAQRIRGREHPQLIKPFRQLCQEARIPYVIENVEGAREELIDPVMLCGAMFPRLNTYRHRLFESSVSLTVPEHPEHEHKTVKMGRPLREGDWYHAVGNFNGGPEDEHKKNYVKRNMGVPWMTREGIRECIPPVYAEHIGRQLITAL